MEPYSCDTFVALPSVTNIKAVIFAKNSDRPKTEVQEVVRLDAASYKSGTKLKCTYIEIDQTQHTHAVVLSKPAWMWGAEMGSNEHGVCIGNEAVMTKLQNKDDIEEKLLGMDLVRLGLERGSTANEAVNVITSLLEEHGQGGPCTDDPHNPVTYHNSFIVADATEAWVVETAGRHWATQQIKDGVRNISNQLSIGTQIASLSPGLRDLSVQKKWWDSEKEKDFDFAKVIADSAPPTLFSPEETPAKRFDAGRQMMEDAANNGKFSVQDMLAILRDLKSCICRVGTGARNIASTGSQLSVIFPLSSGIPSFHWFTATPNPICSMYKPFTFSDQLSKMEKTTSHKEESDPARMMPRFLTTVTRSHELYRVHNVINPLPGDNANKEKVDKARELEKVHLQIMQDIIEGGSQDILQGWYDETVNKEIQLYRQA